MTFFFCSMAGATAEHSSSIALTALEASKERLARYANNILLLAVC